jgi:hypothetical protein
MTTKLQQLLTLNFKGHKYVVGAAALFAAVAYLFVVAPQVMAAVLVAILALACAGLLLMHFHPAHPWAGHAKTWLDKYGIYTQALFSALLAGFLFLSLFISPAAMTVAVVYAAVCFYLDYLAQVKASHVEEVTGRDEGVDARTVSPA